MIVTVVFKDPDAVYYALEDIKDEDQRSEIKEEFRKWFRYSEYVTLKYDTENKTMTIEPDQPIYRHKNE